VLDALMQARDLLATELEQARPELVHSAQAAEVLELFCAIERLGAAGKVLFTKRAADSARWRDEGHRSAASWMAQKTKTPVGEAMATLGAAEALALLPDTAAALRRGELSVPQVRAITDAAATRPEAEGELLALAGEQSLAALQRRCAQVKALASSAKEEAERYQAMAASRYLRHWSDPDGAFRLEARLTPDAGAVVLASLAGAERACFDTARRAGQRLAPGQARADALVALLSGDAPDKKSATGTKATVVLRVDATALRRGHVEAGETCMIPGIGPVPVAVVRRQLPQAFVKILLTDGVDVQAVCHVGRAVPAVVQSALEERDPTCVVPGCDRALGLENHHWRADYAVARSTTLRDLARVCSWHHDLVTYDGYVLRGGPGKWEYVPPEGGTDFDTS